MNKKLLAAEKDVLEFIQTRSADASELIAALGDKHDEAELRAAMWTLQADGKAKLENWRLIAVTP